MKQTEARLTIEYRLTNYRYRILRVEGISQHVRTQIAGMAQKRAAQRRSQVKSELYWSMSSIIIKQTEVNNDQR